MKKTLVSVATAVALFGAMAVPAFASNAGDGSDYGSMPGFDQAQSQTACSGAGAFDYFGKDLNLGIKTDPTDPGANGTQTGINNSTLCGNPQN